MILVYRTFRYNRNPELHTILERKFLVVNTFRTIVFFINFKKIVYAVHITMYHQTDTTPTHKQTNIGLKLPP